MSRFLNTKPVTSEGWLKFLSFTLAPVIQTMDDAIRRINISMLESAIGIAMVFYGSLVDYRPQMPYFILSSLEFSNQCVKALRFCFSLFLRISEISWFLLLIVK